MSDPNTTIQPAEDQPPSTPETPGAAVDGRPEWDKRFALWAGVVGIAVVIAAFLFFQIPGQLGLSDEEWAKLSANSQFAARVTAVLLGFGALALALGAWMAVVEWRGSFKPEFTAQGLDVGKVIEAVGKLRGAALVMVTGALLMLGAAWITSSAATPPAAPAPTPSASGQPG